jgi:choline monooxygenase
MDLSDYRLAADTAAAETLPSRWYTDPEIYANEEAQIFRRSWQWVGRADQVAKPGDYFTLELFGEPVVVARDLHGELHALSNVCRHRAGKMIDKCGSTRALRCQYHGWTYALDGKLLGAREFENVDNWCKDEVRLPKFSVGVWGPWVFVNLDPGARPLAEELKPIDQEITAAGYDLTTFRFGVRRDYEVKCNWKVYIDNYQEGYHIPSAHPALHKELDYDEYRVDCYPGYAFQHAPVRRFAPGDPRAKDRRYATGTDEKRTLYYWIFPNWMVNIYPDNISINLVLPLGLDRTLTVFEWYFTDEKLALGEKWIAEEAAFSDGVQHEDIEICEAVQKGLRSSTYDTGRFSPKRENGVHHFHRLLHQSLAQ